MSGKIICLLLLAVAVAHADVRLDILLSARNLPNMDIFEGSPDAFVLLSYAESDTSVYTPVGETINHSDNNNPDWTEIYTFYVTGAGGTNSPQKLKLEIWDADSPDADDYIGFVEIHLSDLVNAFGHRIEKPVGGAETGTLIIQGKVDGTFPAGEKIDERFLNEANVKVIPTHVSQSLLQ